MKIRNAAFAAVAALAFGTGSAQAQSFAQCIGTETVHVDGTIVDAAIATPELSTLVDAVVAAGLDGVLAETEDLTVFAPTNDAFAAIPTAVLDTLLADVDVLTEVLTYHVIARLEDPRKYIQPRRVEAVNGQSLYLSRFDGSPRINQSAASCTQVEASNGRVFLIDSVLTPQFLQAEG